MPDKQIITDGIIGNHIYYENDIHFSITPDINDDDAKLITLHLEKLRSIYMYNDRSTYFWDFCGHTNTIVIDGNTDCVENDIFLQFTNIAFWFISKNYSVHGSFFYRTDKFIEYITLDESGKMIMHYIILDTIDPTINRINANSVDNILLDAKNKIASHKNNMSNWQPIYYLRTNGKFIAYRNNYKDYSALIPANNSVPAICNDVDKISFDMLEERLDKVENKLKDINKINKKLWKLCAIMGLITLGTIIMYTILSSDNNNSNINNTNITFPIVNASHSL